MEEQQIITTPSSTSSEAANASTIKPKFSKTQLIALNAALCALIMMFVFAPITIGTLQLAFIPIIAVIISAEFIGLKNGIFSGLFFGLVSLVNQFIHPSILAQAFYNPLVSITPRILIGVVAYFAAHGSKKLFPKLPDLIAYGIGSAFGVITNTTLVLGTIMLFNFGDTFGSSTFIVGWEWIVATITGNFLIELCICTIVTPPIILALKKVIHPSEKTTSSKSPAEGKTSKLKKLFQKH